jgi:hypothetical protein
MNDRYTPPPGADILILWLAMGTAGVQRSEAGTLLVYNNNDVGAGSLRQAVSDNQALGGGNTVVFSNVVTGTITLVASELVITNDIIIQGPGADVLTVSGNNAHRVFNLVNANVSLSGLTIAYGKTNSAFGGGLFSSGGTLTMNNCLVVSNTTPFGGNGGGVTAVGGLIASNCTFYGNGNGGNGLGGGVANIGTLVMTNCLLVANSAGGGSGGVAVSGGSDGSGGQAYGGGLYTFGPLIMVRCALANNSATGGGGGGPGSGSGGGIYNDGDLTLLNCTIASNSVSGSSFDFGGGIYHNGTTLTVRGATLSGNQADFGGGIYAGSTPDLGNTILAGNSAGNGPDGSGNINSSDYNLIQNTSGITFSGTIAHNILGRNPLLGPLADNGGLTWTMALPLNSPVADQGKNFGLTTDQRGAPRPFDYGAVGNAGGGDGSDIGAFELGSPRLNIQAAGSAAVLSWPSSYGDFSARSVANLTASNNWADVPGTPVISGSQLVLTNSPVSGTMFFQLKSR